MWVVVGCVVIIRDYFIIYSHFCMSRNIKLFLSLVFFPAIGLALTIYAYFLLEDLCLSYYRICESSDCVSYKRACHGHDI